MKGMNLKKLVVVLTALFLMSIFSVTAMAATFDSVNAAQAERDHWATKGEYYGYTAKNGKTIQKGGSAYAVVRLKNSKKSAKITVICKKNGKMSYKLDGKKMKYAKIEKYLKRSSSKRDKYKVLAAKTDSVMKELSSYAENHNWIFEAKEHPGKNEIFTEACFYGTGGDITIDVTIRRQTNKFLVVHYVIDGHKVQKDDVFKYLEAHEKPIKPVYHDSNPTVVGK